MREMQVRRSDMDDSSPLIVQRVFGCFTQPNERGRRLDLPAEGDQKTHTEGGILKGQ